jgi:hypothetical protein
MTGLASDDLRSFLPVSDVLILVALDRADRHQRPNRRGESGVVWRQLIEHLGFTHNSWTTRKLRPQVEALIDAGLVVRTRNASRVRWGLTDSGALRVAQARIDGEAVLPVSPQRRQWQRGRSIAEVRIDSIHERLGRELREVLRLLESGTADSGDWYDAGGRLGDLCDRLGAATFCLREWDEPDDERPELDDESPTNCGARRALGLLRDDALDVLAG